MHIVKDRISLKLGHYSVINGFPIDRQLSRSKVNLLMEDLLSFSMFTFFLPYFNTVRMRFAGGAD